VNQLRLYHQKIEARKIEARIGAEESGMCLFNLPILLRSRRDTSASYNDPLKHHV